MYKIMDNDFIIKKSEQIEEIEQAYKEYINSEIFLKKQESFNPVLMVNEIEVRYWIYEDEKEMIIIRDSEEDWINYICSDIY